MEIHDAKVAFFTLSGTVNHMHRYPTIWIMTSDTLLVSTFSIKPLFLKIELKHFLERTWSIKQWNIITPLIMYIK